MAKPRQTVVIEKLYSTANYCLYVTAPDALIQSIREIEGVESVNDYKCNDGSRRVSINLRYNLDDIASEIHQLAADYDTTNQLLGN